MRFFSPLYVLHSQPISFFFIISVQIMKFFKTRSSPATCYLEPLRLKYLPQHPILEHPHPTILKLPVTYKMQILSHLNKIAISQLKQQAEGQADTTFPTKLHHYALY